MPTTPAHTSGTRSRGNPGAEGLREHRVGGQAAANEAVESRTVLGVVHAHEGDVLNLVRDVLAGVAGDSGLEFARQVMEFLARQVIILDFFDGWGGIDNLVLGHAGNWRA